MESFPVGQSPCLSSVPQGTNIIAYSLNFTVQPLNGGPLGYLQAWAENGAPPSTSILNDDTGEVLANAAIIGAGNPNGGLTVLPSQTSDVIVDINGYFAAPGSGGYSFYATAPCRVIDTRQIGNGQPFNGMLSPPVDPSTSPCASPSGAGAYVFNATVVPSGSLWFLTLWPDGEGQPLVSTLNAGDASISSNMAIVPNGTDGKIDAYGAGTTQLILDISGYFAQ
jgi:hypothetical protein